jgi:Domain of unknown function (DUF2017)
VKVKRKGPVLRVDLQPSEASLLATLCDDLTELLDADDEEDPAIRRLYPDGYTDDESASAEYRGLVAADLRSERSARIQVIRAQLPGTGGRVELDAEAVDRWLRVLNDLRLVLGTRLGVTEEEELDPQLDSTALYHWLSAVQEMLVMHLMD